MYDCRMSEVLAIQPTVPDDTIAEIKEEKHVVPPDRMDDMDC